MEACRAISAFSVRKVEVALEASSFSWFFIFPLDCKTAAEGLDHRLDVLEGGGSFSATPVAEGDGVDASAASDFLVGKLALFREEV